MTCQSCGAQIDDDLKKCPYCETTINHKNSAIPDDAKIINIVNNYNTSSVAETAKKTESSTNVPEKKKETGIPKNKWIAFILCVLFGYFGAHKFYEGKKNMGILYLCTIGLLGIGWILDCIKIWSYPDTYYV